MIDGFKRRRPWAAAVVSLLFGPFIAMLYLGRAAPAFFYLAIGFALSAALIYFFPSVGSAGLWLTGLPLNAVGAIHGARIARGRDGNVAVPFYSRWYSLVAVLIGFYAVAFVIRVFFVQPFNAVSTSMSPTLNQGDYFFVSKRAYDGHEPARGDLVAFRTPDGDFVKRIVGLPGDRIQMVGGALVLDGKPAGRRRVADFTQYGLHARQYVETLPPGRSYRTLDLADTPQDNTVVFVVPAGHYFVLGDNRDNSDDSRLNMGFVGRGNIIGKVSVKFADAEHTTLIWMPVE